MVGKPKLTKAQIKRKILSVQKSLKGKRTVRYSDLREINITERQIRTHFGSLKKMEAEFLAEHPELYPENHTAGKRTKTREEYIEILFKKRKELGRPLLYDDVIRLMNGRRFSVEFGKVAKLDSIFREHYPDFFNDISLAQFKNRTHVRQSLKKIKNHNRFIVTTAVTGCEVDEDFYASLKVYCKKNDAKLLILVAEDPARPRDKETGERYIADSLYNDDDVIIVADTELNSNIKISTVKLSAKQIDATTGFNRLAEKGTFIYAAPKQRLRPVPVSNKKYIHLLVTTGAVTVSDYTSEMYMSKRTAYLADFDHVVGALVVELDENDKYHFRHVQADATDGSFRDLGFRYSPEGVTCEAPIGIQPGDWHTGSTDPMVKACIKDMLGIYQPKYLFLHDFFDGLSINHHAEKDRITLALLAEKGLLSLDHELEQLKNEMTEITSWGAQENVIVYSNHDDFLNRYLRAGKYTEPSQAQNHRTSLKLALALLDGLNPVEYGVNELFKFRHQKSWRWLDLDEDFIVAGIQMAAHGHLGANGKHNPSIAGLENIYTRSNTGHTHSSEILRGAWRAGTSTYLKLGYNKGPGSWSQSHIWTYANGSRQIIYTIDGKYHLDSKVYGY